MFLKNEIPIDVAPPFIQPGNNYRAGASVLEDALDQPPAGQTMQDVADALNAYGGNFYAYSVPLVWSQMLTVWRKLHVETDSMARPTFAENTVSGQWDAPRFEGGQLWIDISDQPNNDDVDNGYIRIQAAGFPDLISIIIDHDSSVGDDNVRTNISVATWGARPDSGDFIASDDDLSDEALFTAGVVGSVIGVGDPPDGFLPLPDTSGLVAHYQPAYILSVVEGEHTSTMGIAFVKNINNITDESAWDPVLPLRGLPVSTPGFWTTYVYSAFQAEQSEDFDGELEATKGICTHKESLFGNVPPYSGFGQQYTGMSAIFVEALRDGFAEVAQRITIAHEIAHTLGVDHSTGLMGEETQTNEFSAQSLVELRQYQGP